ncbi:MAG: dynamin family protein [Deltaproteobacteria bacterium]|nr:dynamin family protein [Deltaproteobacteria bacterium]
MTSDSPTEMPTSFAARVKNLKLLIDELATDQPQNRDHLERWRQSLDNLMVLRSDFILPLACIGPVKSGKSTLINTLAGSELLPTGAGITTNFPTTVRAGKSFSARIRLQPQKLVTQLFSTAATLLFRDLQEIKDFSPFQEHDRAQISELLDEFQQDGTLTRHGIFNESYRLLRNLLSGAEKVQTYYQNTNLDLIIVSEASSNYRDFIRDESLSPYLVDITLTTPIQYLPPHLALRDLPGLDTPNPSHQAVIIQQLAESPALAYIISSRIGLRQADYQLLEYLRTMRLEERLMFIINLDLDEHPNLDELKNMLERCRQELRELGFTQEIYSFSSLALFWSKPHIYEKLAEPLRQRLERWRTEKEKLAFSSQGADLFLARLSTLGKSDAAKALFQHSESRLQQIHNNLERLISSRLSRLSEEEHLLQSEQEKQEQKREQLNKVLQECERITAGLSQKIEKYAFTRINNWLEDRSENGLQHQLRQLLESYRVPLDLLPDKNRNPMAPIRIIDNHFKLTMLPRLKEQVMLASLNFLQRLQQEIKQQFIDGSTPLFIISSKFVDDQDTRPQELPLPLKIEGELPEFTTSSKAEERFEFIEKIQELFLLWGRKATFFRRHRPLGEEYGSQLKRKMIQDLPRQLSNYSEQIKYALLRPHLENCRLLVSNFFFELLLSFEMTLQPSRNQSTNDPHRRTEEREFYQRLKNLLDETRTAAGTDITL